MKNDDSTNRYFNAYDPSGRHTCALDHVSWFNILAVLGVYMGVRFASWLHRYIQIRREVRGLYTIHSGIEVFEAGHRSALRHIPGLIPAKKYTIDDSWKKYETARSDLIACTQATTPYAVYITSNPSVLASVSAKPNQFLKPTSMFRYVAIDIFGRQIVSCQTGPEHSRHKKVVKGCFNETIMRGVWDGIVEAFEVMVKECGVEDGGVVNNLEETLVQVTLLVIGQIGFNQKWPWHIEQTDSNTHPLSEALYVVEHSMFPQLVLPLWLMKYNPIKARFATVQTSLIHHIKLMIAKRQAELSLETSGLAKGEKVKPPSDVLGAIVASQMDVEAEAKIKAGLGLGDGGIAGLAPEEIIGNVWIFIVAGHETSAHVLGFAVAYLALYPEHQERILAEVDENVPFLRYILAVIYESIRLRDIVMTLPKLVAEDTSITYTTWDESGRTTEHTRLLKKGSHLIIDSPACQRNPYTWNDPMSFRPERMLQDNAEFPDNRHVFTGFSMGSRVCIGKRFAEVELVGFLACFVKTFKFEPIAKEGETREQLVERYLEGKEVLNLTPGKWDLKLTKRL